jgi:hypothetical protein
MSKPKIRFLHLIFVMIPKFDAEMGDLTVPSKIGV